MNSPKVSIIMPMYNAEKTLKKSIISVLKQSYPHFELIICDDSSIDSSYQIAQQFQIQDSRIRLIKNNLAKGCGFARKKALSIATGQLIAFLDSDDLWSSEKLASQINYMLTQNISFCFGNYYTIDQHEKIKGQFIAPSSLSYYDLLKTNSIGCLTVMFQSSLLNHIEIPTEHKEDYRLWLKILQKHAIKAYNYNGYDAYYRLSNKSLSSNKYKEIIKQWQVLNTLSLSFFQKIKYISAYILFGLFKHLILYKNN